MAQQILIAEDNPDLRLIFDEIFRHAGFEVVLAPDGREAMKLLDSRALPNAIILDLNMPGATGMEVLEYMRRCGTLEQVTVIVVTGNSVAGRFIDSALVDMVLIKPVDPMDLIALTKRRLQRSAHAQV